MVERPSAFLLSTALHLLLASNVLHCYFFIMTEAELALTQHWVDTWAKAAPELQKVRDADIRAADTSAMIECTNLLFRDAVKNFPPKPTSGLIEQQHWFMKLRPT